MEDPYLWLCGKPDFLYMQSRWMFSNNDVSLVMALLWYLERHRYAKCYLFLHQLLRMFFLYFALVEIWMMLNFGKYQYAEHYLKFLKFTCQLDLMKKSVAYQYCDNVTFVH